MPLSEDFITTVHIPGKSSEEPIGDLEQARITQAIVNELIPVLTSLRSILKAITHIDGDPVTAIQRVHLSGTDRVEAIQLTFTVEGGERIQTFAKDEFYALAPFE